MLWLCKVRCWVLIWWVQALPLLLCIASANSFDPFCPGNLSDKRCQNSWGYFGFHCPAAFTGKKVRMGPHQPNHWWHQDGVKFAAWYCCLAPKLFCDFALPLWLRLQWNWKIPTNKDFVSPESIPVSTYSRQHPPAWGMATANAETSLKHLQGMNNTLRCPQPSLDLILLLKHNSGSVWASSTLRGKARVGEGEEGLLLAQGSCCSSNGLLALEWGQRWGSQC